MKTSISFIILLIITAACVSIPPSTHSQFEKIKTGMGPEDMVLDTLSTQTPRLLISCSDHRLQEKAPIGNIYVVNLKDAKQTSSILPRLGEPDTLRLHPHGIDLIRQNGKVYLYVVSHDLTKNKHHVVKYEVTENALNFVAVYEHPFMVSPNSVVALKKGGFYISNDQKNRKNRLAAFLAAKSGNLVYCDENEGWAIVADKLAYPNGLHITPKERYLYVSTTRQHQVFKYTLQEDGNIINKTKVVKAQGGDNIRIGDADELLLPAHLKVFKFVGHFKDSTKLAPSVVYGIDKAKNEKKVIYANDGEQISAASTALYYEGYYYIAQVFQPFIIKVKKK